MDQLEARIKSEKQADQKERLKNYVRINLINMVQQRQVDMHCGGACSLEHLRSDRAQKRRDQMEIEKLKIVSKCFANTTYTGPEMAMQHRMLVGSMLNNMGMSGLMPQFVQNGGGGGIESTKKMKKGQVLRDGVSSKRVS